MMNNYSEYYKKTSNATNHKLIENIKELSTDIQNIIELGCGVGRDTVYLLKNGYNVLGIDKEATESLIRAKLTENENSNFKFIQSDFENLNKLPKTDLVLSLFSLPFCSPNKFDELWENICNSISDGKYFLGNFFAKNDEWKFKKEMTFMSLEEVKNLFKNFEILTISEKEYDKPSAMGKMKHWDVIEVFAVYKKHQNI